MPTAVQQYNSKQPSVYYPPMFLPWLMSEEYADRLDKVSVKHGLKKTKFEALEQLLRDIFILDMPLSQLADTAKVSLFLNTEESKLLARDILGYLVLPLSNFFEDSVSDLIVQWSGRPSEYPSTAHMREMHDQIDELYAIEADELLTEARIMAADRRYADDAQAVLAEEVSVSHEKSQELEQKLKDLYRSVQTDHMQQAREHFSALFSDVTSFTKEFYQVINDRDIDKVIGALWVIAEHGELTTLLVNDKKIQSLYSKHLARKFSESIAEHFDLHPEEPVYLSYFLQYLLQETLKMEETNAAALAIHLLNEERKTTRQAVPAIAYGDMTSVSFKWNDIKDQETYLELV